jgi:hypothetical protein
VIFLTVAQLMAVGQGVTLVIVTLDGALGRHTEFDAHGRPTPDFVDRLNIYKEGLFYLTLVTFPALAFVKVSILCFYRRIFRGKVFSILTTALLAIVVAWGIAFFFAFLFHCHPIHLAWTGTPGVKKGCFYPIPLYYAHAISDTLLDTAIWSIPIPLVWKLVMPTRQKVAVSGIFLLGAFVLGISIARCVFFFETGRGQGSGVNPADVTYNAAPTLYWTFLESSIAVICACLPTLRILFKDASPQRILRSWASKLSLRSPAHSQYASDAERASHDLPKTSSSGLVHHSEVDAVQLQEVHVFK